MVTNMFLRNLLAVSSGYIITWEYGSIRLLLNGGKNFVK
jgi:hypothetical protein